MPFQIIRDDISRVWADAIVNSANPKPMCGRGSDTAIYQAAGWEKLLAAREKIGEIKPGDAAVTPAYGLHARVILHTVGPVWHGGTEHELEVLASCYRTCLSMAEDLKCESIAFPLISTGVYGFPKDRALAVALAEIRKFLETSEMDVTLVVFDRRAYELSAELVSGVRAYIDEKYVADAYEKHGGKPGSSLMEDLLQQQKAGAVPPPQAYHANYAPPMAGAPAEPARKEGKATVFSFLKKKKAQASKDQGLVLEVGETFAERLFALIDERGLTDAEVYKKANLDRKLFSKIRCNENYKPGKRTAVALAVALQLNLDETVDLLGRAEMALSPSNKFDLIVEYCIEHGIYDVIEINSLLFEYDQPLLGS